MCAIEFYVANDGEREFAFSMELVSFHCIYERTYIYFFSIIVIFHLRRVCLLVNWIISGLLCAEQQPRDHRISEWVCYNNNIIIRLSSLYT